MMTADKNLRLIEQELKFIARHVQTIEGAHSHDFETVDEIAMATNSALRALAEHNLTLQQAAEEIPAGVALPEAA